VLIGDRLRALRRAKNVSQDEIEERAGLLQHYLSGVENGETVPSIEMLENIAGALEVPLCQLFYDGEEPPALPNLPNRRSAEDIALGGAGSAAGLLPVFSRAARSHRRARSASDSPAGSEDGANGVGRSGSGKLTPKGVQGMGDHAYNSLNRSAVRQGISFHRNWAAGGGAMDLQCPRCQSTDLKRVSLAYREGLYRVDTRTRLAGVLIGSGGPDMIVGRARTKGFRQTELSKLLSPPMKWSYWKLLSWAGLVSVAALIAYVNYAMASPPPVSVLPVKLYALLAPAALVVLAAVFWRHNHSTYRRQYAGWDRSFVCERCGAVSQHDLSES
jgi:transcriptional regulator with XRE-family HTH domain